MGDKVLVVEDERTLRETLEYNLIRQGYEVLTAADGRCAVAMALRERPDLLVLDVMLPELDGLEVCRILRQEMNVPILMLTARADEVDKVVGRVGADDYMTKPFSMRELLARVKAMLRRVRLIREDVAGERREGEAGQDGAMIFGDLRIDLTRREATRAGQILSLKPKEFDLCVSGPQSGHGALTGPDLGAGVGLELWWREPHCGRARSLAARKDRIGPGPAHAHHYRARRRLSL
jgi:DNA-binding response OmpR family regulator